MARPKVKPKPSDDAMDVDVDTNDNAVPLPIPDASEPSSKAEIKAHADDEDDPITASYQVYLNPSLPLGRRLLVLQHPNRTDEAPRPAPSELRLKSGSGMVEVDVPLDSTVAYDREKGLRWGRSLQTSMAAKNGGSHGLAGGFGFGAVQQRTSKKKGEEEADEVLDWNDAVRQDKVLRTQTLGGQYPDTDEVQYMVGVFQGKDLHLTPVSSLVHLRPQLHHIDATTQLERQAASTATKDTTAAPASSAARAIHMTIKNATDGETVAAETMADRLRSVQSEPWRKMRYTDENEESAWEIYNESLFLRHEDETRTEESGEAQATAAEENVLEDLVPKFSSKWGDKQLLEAVSGIKKPEAEPPLEVEADPKAKDPQVKADADGSQQPKGRTRGGAARTVSRRGRAKTTSTRGASTVNID